MTTEELRGIVLKQFYDQPEPPPLPFRSHPSPRLRQIKGGGLQSHQASRVQEFLMGGEGSAPWPSGGIGCRQARSARARPAAGRRQAHAWTPDARQCPRTGRRSAPAAPDRAGRGCGCRWGSADPEQGLAVRAAVPLGELALVGQKGGAL